MPEAASPARPPAGIAARLRFDSLAAALAAAFGATLAMILLIASGWMYWGLQQRMNQEDREAVERKLDSVVALLAQLPMNSQAVKRAAYLTLPVDVPHNLFLEARGASGDLLLQSPGLQTVLPASAPGGAGPAQTLQTLRLADGRHFLIGQRDLMARTDENSSPQSVRLTVALNRSTEARMLRDYRVNLGLVLLVAVGVATAAGYAIAWRGLRPLRELALAAQDIGARDLHRRLDATALPAELRTLAAAFNATLERLEESFGRISQFSADIAHELRTPIANIWGELEVALGRPRDAAQYREVLESSMEECARLSQLIQALLFLAQTEQANHALRYEKLDLSVEFRRIADYFEAAAAEAGVSLSVHCEPGLELQADHLLLQRALVNLVANALAHTPSGGAVQMSAQQAGTALCIDVSDTGSGIAPEHLPHIFDRFYRADAARTRQGGGFGLGLALVRNIVHLHAGDVGAQSELGHGTRISIRLPHASVTGDALLPNTETGGAFRSE